MSTAMDDGAASVAPGMESPVEPSPVPDPAAIERLWQELNCDLRRRGSGVQLAEDVTQEAWLRALSQAQVSVRALAVGAGA
jgi:DNA-directed RNA polymerase specialized sigma24 family protein